MSLLGALLALCAAWAMSLACARIGVPDVLAFGLLGVVGGGGMLGIWHLSLTGGSVRTVVTLGAALLLYDSGRGMHLESVRSAWRGLTVLVTWGVLLTAALTALVVHSVFAWGWGEAALLGATVASTDPAAVISILRQIPLMPRVSHIAQAESALNDATGSMLTVILAGVLAGRQLGVVPMAAFLGRLALGGVAVGVGLAAATAALVRLRQLSPDRAGEHDRQLLELLTMVAAVVVSDQIGASVFVAAFVAGVTHAAMLPKDDEDAGAAPFRSLLAFLARLAIFLVLGATLDLGALARGPLETAVLGAAFIFLIRPITVLASLLPDRAARWSRGEIALLCWVRETGAIPAALAAYLVAEGVPGAPAVETQVAGVILITVLVQGLSTRGLARRLGLLVDESDPVERQVAAGRASG